MTRAGGVGIEAAVLVCCAPALLFPLQFPKVTIAAVLLIAAASIGGAVARGSWRVPTPLFWPTLALCVMVAAGAVVSTMPDVSVPKLTGVALGVLVARLLVLGLETRAQLWQAVFLYLFVGAGTVVSGVLGTRWLWASKTALAALVSRIPMLVHGLPGAENGVNPNALGGTTLFFIPLAACLAIGVFRLPAERVRAMAMARAAALVLLPCVIVVLVLSQSRTSWVSAVGALLLIAAIVLRRHWWVWVGGAAIVAVVVFGLIRPTWTRTEAPANTPLSRSEIWRAAIEDIRSSPWAGIGLNVFRRTLAVRPRPAGPPADVDVAHAHNVFLQTALDTGLPGLAAYVALLAIAAALCLRIYASASVARPERALALGLLGNVVAIHLFGMTDAIVLGAKVGLFLWWNLGLIGALHLRASKPEHV